MQQLSMFGLFAATAFAVAVSTSAKAEVARVRCNENTSVAATVDVDLTNGSAYIVYDDGRPPQSVRAAIDDRFITWSAQTWNVQTHRYSGQYISERLDRATGVLNWSQGAGWLGEGSCKRLSKPVL